MINRMVNNVNGGGKQKSLNNSDSNHFDQIYLAYGFVCNFCA